METMKEISGATFRILVIAFAWMLFTSSAVHAQAAQNASGAQGPKEDCDFRHGEHGEHEGYGALGDRLLHRMTEELNLTEAQKAQVRQIIAEEKGNIEPLMEQLRGNRTKLFELSKSGQFDEAAVRAIADGQASLISDLIVEKERVKTKVYSILTPEQKTKADAMIERMENQMGHFGR